MPEVVPNSLKQISHTLAYGYLSAGGIIPEDVGRIPKGPKSADFDQKAWPPQLKVLKRFWSSAGNRPKLPKTSPLCLQMVSKCLRNRPKIFRQNSQGSEIGRF